MNKYERELQILHSPFDLDTHVKTFVCYCEVIMWPDGKVEYAVPSHVEKLIQAYSEKTGLSIDALKECLAESTETPYYRRLMDELGVAFIWYDSIYSTKRLTKKQYEQLNAMLVAGAVSDRILQDMTLV